MPATATTPPTITPANSIIGRVPLRLGFVPLIDCAPLIVAQEMGIFRQYGLSVRLEREPGWATIRDKIVIGRELDAAHSLAGLAFAATYGINTITRHCVTGLVINAHGNAITFSNELWDAGVRDAKSLAKHISVNRGQRLCFGVVHPFSSHNFLLRAWFIRSGIRVGDDVEIVVIPPEMMSRNLQKNHLAGFCVGEPWNTVAIASGIGHAVATSADLFPMHPEKILLTTNDFAESREEEHIALIQAILEACKLCDQLDARPEIAMLLARREYLSIPKKTIHTSLCEDFHFGDKTEPASEFHRFSGDEINAPSPDKANWIMSHIRLGGLIDQSRLRAGGEIPVSKILRMDIYERASKAPSNRLKTQNA
jgi:ABC-type nitrate/sulfonate/bicarbonate transport system substrate-binding protein